MKETKELIRGGNIFQYLLQSLPSAGAMFLHTSDYMLDARKAARHTRFDNSSGDNVSREAVARLYFDTARPRFLEGRHKRNT